MGAVTEEARKEGLTVEGAKIGGRRYLCKSRRVVDAAGKSIS